MTSLLLEPFSGISGDMFLGALAPLLDAEAEIVALPSRLGLDNVTVGFSDVVRSTLRCRKCAVTVNGHAPESHPRAHDHGHSHHHPGHGHDPGHGSTHHAPRAYTDIVHLVQHADLPEGVRELALEMFRLLGGAEAEMHGMPLEEVHFHEVGGEDSIIDLVGAALLIDRLSPDAVYCSPVCVGSGFVKTAHGRLPVPAPATRELLHGMPTFPGPVEKEMTTPSGAVILAALNPVFSIPTLVTRSTSLGAGTRELDQPNALRAGLCSTAAGEGREAIVLLQTNLDNVSGEDLGADWLRDLLDAGALDAWLAPVLMKKGRPGHKLEVLCVSAMADELCRMILKRLPTLGVRRFEGARTVLDRGSETVSTDFGDIELKIHKLPDGTQRRVPEYESLNTAADRHGLSVQELRRKTES